MYQFEKPKRQSPLETEEDIKRAYQNFYWRLILILMLPACILGSLFMLPVIVFNSVSDYAESSCRVSDNGRSIRITSATRGNNQITYQWSGDGGKTWRTIFSDFYNPPYIGVNCDSILFDQGLTFVYYGIDIIMIADNATVTYQTACDGDSIVRVNRTESDNLSPSERIVAVQCDNGSIIQLRYNMDTDE
jgi:hypothetical protein